MTSDEAARPTLATRFSALKDQGTLILDAATFGESPPVVAAFGLASLTIAHAVTTFDGTTLAIAGTTSLLGQYDLRIVVEVTGPVDPHVAATVTLPPDWRMPASFAVLPPGYRPTGRLPGIFSLGSSLFADLRFTSASLVSCNTEADGLVPGLNLVGTLADTDVFDWIAPALALPRTPRIAGPVVLGSDGAPTSAVLAVAAPDATLAVGSFFTVGAVNAALVTTPDHNGTMTSAVQAAGTLAIGSTDPVTARIAGRTWPGVKQLTLEACFPPGEIGLARGLDALAELAGLGSADLPVPTGALPDLSLTELSVMLDWSQPRVDTLQFGIATSHPWQIVDDLAVTDLRIGWRVLYPFDPEARDISAGLTGTLQIGTSDPILLDIAAYSHDGFTVTGDLRAGSVVRLGDLVAKAIGVDADELPSIDVVALSVAAATDGTFRLDAVLEAWGLTIPGIAVTLEKVTGSFARSSIGVSGRIAALFALGKVELWVSAGIPAPGAGFQFVGETFGTAQRIPLGDLSEGLVGTFGATLPAALVARLDDIVLTKITVSFDDGSGNFAFTAAGTITLSGTTADIGLDIAVARIDTGGYALAVIGTVGIGQRTFTLLFADAPSGDVLAAHYVAPTGDTIDVGELVGQASPEMGELVPRGIAIGIKDAVLLLSKRETGTDVAFGLTLDGGIDLAELPLVGKALPAAADASIKALQFTYSSSPIDAATVTSLAGTLGKAGVTLPAAGLGQGVMLNARVALSGFDRPLALAVPPAAKASSPSNAPDAVATASSAPTPPSTEVSYLDVKKQFGPFRLDRVGAGYTNGNLTVAVSAGMTLGPLSLDLMGLAVTSPLTAFHPEFSLDGLSLKFSQGPLAISGGFLKVAEPAGPSYYGEISVTVAKFGLTALGGYRPAGDDRAASFFIFANVEIPLGGPPFFFVTGFAGGFGVNRRLVLPTFDTLPGYLLLPNNAPPQGDSPQDMIRAVLPKIQSTFPPLNGEYWLAAGISFTSFEMIEAFALVTVSFGVDFEVALLGSCAMTFPKGASTAIAYIEIDLVASFTPASGRVGLMGMLTPASYVYGGLVHVSGGFAFYVWYDGPHKGDFVVSIGGYHPAFRPPAHYPAIPRLKMNFGIGALQVVGETYFALTPAIMMAGLAMRATWQSGKINASLVAGIDFLIAWAPFHYQGRAYISIGCSVDIGLFTLVVHAGADLQIWGPDFGGQVAVDLDVVSFRIAFGAEATAPPPVGWQAFSDGFLPAPSALPTAKPAPSAAQEVPAARPAVRAAGRMQRTGTAFRANPMMAAAARPGTASLMKASVPSAAAGAAPVANGCAFAQNLLTATIEKGIRRTNANGYDWILDSDDFAIAITSLVPATQAAWGTDSANATAIPADPACWDGVVKPEQTPLALELADARQPISSSSVWNAKLGLRPMGQRDISSTIVIGIRRHASSDTEVFSQAVDEIRAMPILLDVASALYANSAQGDDANEPATVPKALVGMRLTSVPRRPRSVSNVPLAALLYQSGDTRSFVLQSGQTTSAYAVGLAAPTADSLAITLDGPDVSSGPIVSRGWVLSALADPGLAARRAATLATLRARGFGTRSDAGVDLARFAGKTVLTAWPGVGTLGAAPRRPAVAA